MSGQSEKALKTLIARGEGQRLDFKFEISDAKKIARTLSAFSNTEGGTLLIGVKDNGRISGIRSDEEFYMLESAASLFCRPEVHFDSFQHLVEGRQVLEVYIPPVSVKPVYARDDQGRWKAYVRVADENMLASVIHLELWKAEHRDSGTLVEFTRKEQILLDILGRSEASTLSQLQKNSGFPRKKLVPLLTKLTRFGVVRIHYAGGEALFSLGDAPGEVT